MGVLRSRSALDTVFSEAGPAEGLRIGFAYPGDPLAAGTWSGTPAGLIAGLRELQVDVAPIVADPSRLTRTLAVNALALLRVHRTPGPSVRTRLRVSRTIAMYNGPELVPLRTRAARRNVNRLGKFDAFIQLAAAYELPAGPPLATFEDMTVAQALRLPYLEWSGLTRREADARLEFQRRLYDRAVACCFTTAWAAESAVADYGVSRDKVYVVGVGRNHSLTPKLHRDWTTPRFLFIGGDWQRKNGAGLLRAFARVRNELPSAQLDLVGNHPAVDAPGVTGHGWLSLANPQARNEVEGLFESSTCFVLPSLYEPSALAYVEAAAAGLPCIGTTVGGSAELIGEGGLVVDPTDEDALVNAMLDFAQPAVAAERGRKAAEHARSFTWPAVAKRILSTLQLVDG